MHQLTQLCMELGFDNKAVVMAVCNPLNARQIWSWKRVVPWN